MSVPGTSRFTVVLAIVALGGTAGTFWWALQMRSEMQAADHQATRRAEARPSRRPPRLRKEADAFGGETARPRAGNGGRAENVPRQGPAFAPAAAGPAPGPAAVPTSGPTSAPKSGLPDTPTSTPPGDSPLSAFPAAFASPIPADWQVPPPGARQAGFEASSGDSRSGDSRSGDLRSGDLRSGDLRSGDLRSSPSPRSSRQKP